MLYPKTELLHRHPGNPILTAADLPVGAGAVFNSGVVRDGDVIRMMLRIEDVDRFQHFRMAESTDGVHFRVSEDPVDIPSTPETRRYEGTAYDPRITPIEGRFVICFASQGPLGARIGMAETRDFVTFQRLPFGSPVDNRNGVLFPERIGGRYVRLERPLNAKDRGDLWVSFSPDLVHWGDHACVAEVRRHSWDQWKLGAGAVPIKTDRGWLCIVHGACKTASGAIYRLGVLLLDLADPTRLLARSKGYVLAPREPYERVGDVPNVVFTSGAIAEPDGEVKVYYGAADTCMCLATGRLDALVDACGEW